MESHSDELELYEAGAAWAVKALELVSVHPGEALESVPVPHWLPDSQGNFHLVPSQVVLKSAARAAIFQLDEWHQIIAIVDRHPHLKKQFGQQVWAGISGRGYDLESICSKFLIKVETRDGRTLDLEGTACFNSRWRDFVDFLFAQQVTLKWITLLLGVTPEQPHIDLDEHTILRKLHPSEVADALNGGLLSAPIRGQSYIGNSTFEPFGFIFEEQVTKYVGEESIPSRSPNLHLAQIHRSEDFLAALALFGVTTAEIAGFMPMLHGNPQPIAFLINTKFSIPHTVFESHLPAVACAELQRVWRLLPAVGRDVNQALHLAMLRLSYATNRSRIEDQILDLMISAEALYLGSENSKERGELKFRLSLNAAKWSDLESHGLPQRKVFDLIKKAYDLRSTVAHGTSLNHQRVTVATEEMSFGDFIWNIRLIIRTGLLKAIAVAAEHPNRKFNVNWVELWF